MKNYRSLGIFLEEDDFKVLDEKMENANTFLDVFVNAFLKDLVGLKLRGDGYYEKCMSAAARTYYKAYTGREWQ